MKRRTESNSFSAVVRFASLIGFLLLNLTPQARAVSNLTLTWGPAADPTIAGYTLYYGTASGDYSHRIAMGNQRKLNIGGLIEGVTYFFVVRSRDAHGQESPPSHEMSYTVPGVYLTVGEARSSHGGASLLQIASAGVVPFAWVVEASPDLKIWQPVMSGAHSRVNLSFRVSDAPRMFFRLRQGVAKTRSPLVALTIQRNPSDVSSLQIGTSEVVPFAWVLETTRDFQSWQTCATGSNSVVDVSVITAKSTSGFFRVRSQ